MELTGSEKSDTSRVVWIVLGAGLLIGIAIGLLVFAGNPAQPASTDALPAALEVAPVAGALAPDFTLTDARTGQPISLSELRGRPVLINFWATWCGPCRIEMPFIENAFQQHRGKGFAVLAVDFDEPQQAVAKFGDELDLSFNLLLDPGGEIQNLYRIRAYPSSFFVRSDGTIAGLHLGVMTEGQLAENLALILPDS